MIRLEGVSIKGLDGETHSLADLSFPYEMTDIEEGDKLLFDLFSLRFDSFETGKVVGDSFSFSSENDFSHLFYLSLDVKGFAKLGYVFLMPMDASPLSFRKKIVETLKDLKEKQETMKGSERLNESIRLLKPLGLLYILLDGNNALNEDNWKEIRSLLLAETVPSFAYLPKAKEEKISQKKKVPNKVKEKEKESHIHSGILPFLKEEWTDLAFLAIFSLLSPLGLFCGISFCYEGNALYATLSILVGVICFLIALDIVASLPPSLRKFSYKDTDIPLYEFLSASFALLGGVLGIGLSVLVTSLNLLLEKSYVLPLPLILSILSPTLIVVLSFMPFTLEKGLLKIKSLFASKH